MKTFVQLVILKHFRTWVVHMIRKKADNHWAVLLVLRELVCSGFWLEDEQRRNLDS